MRFMQERSVYLLQNGNGDADFWQHPLFSQSACFRIATPWFTPARLDGRIRKLKNMPSCSDESTGHALAGVETVLRCGRRWLENSRSPVAETCREHLRCADRTRRALEKGIFGEVQLARKVDRVVAEITALTGIVALAEEHERAKAPDVRLEAATRALLDFALLADPELRPRYLKRIHKTLDAALDYNATSDAQRNRNVLLWLRELIGASGRRWLAYADIGCAFQNGAVNAVLAARILRPDQFCREIHGTDIVAPPRELVGRLLDSERILLYRADPVRRPLARRYDVIMLANVHRHLDAELQRKLMANLALSLNENGWLLVNWRFDAANSPAVCLQLRGTTLQVAHEINTATFKAASYRAGIDQKAEFSRQ